MEIRHLILTFLLFPNQVNLVSAVGFQDDRGFAVELNGNGMRFERAERGFFDKFTDFFAELGQKVETWMNNGRGRQKRGSDVLRGRNKRASSMDYLYGAHGYQPQQHSGEFGQSGKDPSGKTVPWAKMKDQFEGIYRMEPLFGPSPPKPEQKVVRVERADASDSIDIEEDHFDIQPYVVREEWFRPMYSSSDAKLSSEDESSQSIEDEEVYEYGSYSHSDQEQYQEEEEMMDENENPWKSSNWPVDQKLPNILSHSVVQPSQDENWSGMMPMAQSADDWTGKEEWVEDDSFSQNSLDKEFQQATPWINTDKRANAKMLKETQDQNQQNPPPYWPENARPVYSFRVPNDGSSPTDRADNQNPTGAIVKAFPEHKPNWVVLQIKDSDPNTQDQQSEPDKIVLKNHPDVHQIISSEGVLLHQVKSNKPNVHQKITPAQTSQPVVASNQGRVIASEPNKHKITEDNRPLTGLSPTTLSEQLELRKAKHNGKFDPFIEGGAGLTLRADDNNEED